MTVESKVKMSKVQAIKAFFNMDSATALKEIRVLTPEERLWFARECAKQMNVELDEQA